MGTKASCRREPGVPKTIYFGFRPSTRRYYRVFELARLRGCSWQDIIRDAIDYYLARFAPDKKA